jgi:cytochrome c-type biogenesis protein CcmF
LYPLLADAMGWGKVSVGPPYFGVLFTWLMVPIVLLMPFGPFAKWRRDSFSALARPAATGLIIASLAAITAWLWVNDLPWRAIAGIFGGAWIIGMSALWAWRLLRDPARRGSFNGGRLGMWLAHIGVGVFVVGVLVKESTTIEKDVSMAPGDRIAVRGLSVEFEQMRRYTGPNYHADQGVFNVYDGDRLLTTLTPAKRQYKARGDQMTEAAIDAGFTRDLYVSLGERIGTDGAWAVRVYHKPFVRWIWLGALLMMLGAFVAALDKRYRRVPASEPTEAPTAQQRAAPALNAAARQG